MPDTKQSDPKPTPKPATATDAAQEAKGDTMIEQIKATRSADRVTDHTSAEVNARIRRQIEANVAYYAKRLDEVENRLNELDREWDIERTLEVNAGTIALAGLGLALLNRRWGLLSAAVAGFLAQHAIQGWCPPLPVFRRLGVRTSREIDQERYALKALRGDFKNVDPDSKDDPGSKAMHALDAACRNRCV